MTENEVIGWHFAATTLRDGSPLPTKGTTLTHAGKVVPCESGYHASERALDALSYAPGAMVARVRLSGTVVAHGEPVDKHAASKRTTLADYVDASRTLHEFACWCAETALDREEAAGRSVDARSRRAVEIKRLWLDGKASDEDLDAAWAAASAAVRAAAWAASAATSDATSDATSAARAAARAAAWAAAWAASAATSDATSDATSAARAAARDAASDATWAASAAARAAAWAARDAASDATSDATSAARAAAWAAARDAARAAQNIELERMLSELFERATV